MSLQDLSSSKPVVQLGIFMGQYMPRPVGIGLARVIANTVAHYKPQIYWTVHANLSQILSPKIDARILHRTTRNVFCHAVQTYYDFFRVLGQPKTVLAKAVRVPEDVITEIRPDKTRSKGVLLLGTHMSNFDLLILALGARGLPMQMLSLANPKAGFHILNHLRAEGGYEVTPITPESLQAAIRRLKNGGVVMTGMDRPNPRDKQLIEFFGRRSYLPLGPARLALITSATVLVGSCCYEDGEYSLEASRPLEMIRSGDRQEDIRINARRLAVVLEGHVRARPAQWMMFHPIWPHE